MYVTVIFDGTPQIIGKRCQILAPRWPNDISSAADNAIFKNRAQNIECSFGCVACSAVLLKPIVTNILLFNFCEQNFRSTWLDNVRHWRPLLAHFRRKMAQLCLWTKIRTKQWLVLDTSAFQCTSICKSIDPSVLQTYTQPYSFGRRIKLIICQIRHGNTYHSLNNY